MPATERDPLAASVATSAFQAVHVLSLVHANQYVPANRPTESTAADDNERRMWNLR